MKLLLAISIAVFTWSCASVELKSETVRQARTLTDLQNEMVLSNVAMQIAAPGSLPWHVKIKEGTVTINDNINPESSFSWPPTSRSLGLSGAREWQVSWTVIPVTDPDQLTALATTYEEAAKGNWIRQDEPQAGCPSGSYMERTVWVEKKDLGKLKDLVVKVLTNAPIKQDERFMLSSSPTATISR